MSAPENAPVRLGLAGNGQAAVVVYVDCQAVPPARLHRGPRASRPTGASLGLSVAVDRRSWRLRSSSCKHHRTLDFQPVFVRSGSRPGSLSNDVISVRQIVGAGIDGEDQFVQITESSFDFFHAQQNCAV